MTLRTRRFLGQMLLSGALLLLFSLHLAAVIHLGFVESFDHALYDLKVRLSRSSQVEERIVIVDIDDKSLKAEGRWPWPREKMARLTGTLYSQYGAAAVGYDIVFSEPDQSSGLPVLEGLARRELAGDARYAELLKGLRPRLDYDGLFAEALGQGPSVLGYFFNPNPGAERIASLPPALFKASELALLAPALNRAQGYGGALPRLLARAAGMGYFNTLPDADGVVRRLPMLMAYDGQAYGALSLMLVKAAYGVEKLKWLTPPAGGLGLYQPPVLDIDGMRVPVDAEAAALVPYRAFGSYRYVSATDVLHGRAPSADLDGRIVLVGTTAPGLADVRSTPLAKIFPGVEIHASLISGILDSSLKWQPRHEARLMVGTVLVVGLVLAMILPWVSPLIAVLTTLGVMVLLLAVDFWLWSSQGLSLRVGVPVLAAAGLFVLNMSWGFFVESRAKGQITKLFGQYIPPELVGEMAKDPARYTLRGEAREMSVLFSDIRDFTSISEGLDATELQDMLNVYLSAMTRIVQQRRGTIDKYIGDAIMAFWGAPLADATHAQDSVLAAMDMQARLVDLNRELQARGWPAIRIGVGVNSGRMSVGNMGSQFRMAYTVMADAVNLASRLEGLTKQYGVGVLVGEETVAKAPDIEYMKIDLVRVKGKQLPVAIFEPLGLKDQVDAAARQRKQEFEAVLDAYLRREWERAEALLNKLNKQAPAKLYEVYLERIAHYRVESPGLDWDGAYTFTSK
jgi:adenylate cyclase